MTLNSAACAVSLAEASSGPTGCDPGSIQIYGEGGGVLTRTWMARCGHAHYRCSGAMRDTVIPFVFDVMGASCTAVGTTLASKVSEPRLVAPIVVREDSEGRRTFTSVLRQGPFQFVLYGIPELNPRRVAFYIEVPPSSVGQPCDIGYAINEEALSSELFRARAEKPERFKVMMELEALQRMAKAETAGGTICSRDWELSKPGQRVLRAFVTAFSKEAAKQKVDLPQAQCPVQ